MLGAALAWPFACGGGSSGTPMSVGQPPSDAGGPVVYPPVSDAAAAALAGRWWGVTSVGPSVLFSGLAGVAIGVPAAIDVAPDAAGHPVATLWIGATPYPIGLGQMDATHFLVTGWHWTFSDSCGVPASVTLVLDGDTFSLETSGESTCSHPPPQPAGTFHLSRARLVHPGASSVTTLGMNATTDVLAYAVGVHPWVWDATQQQRIDMAPGNDGGAIATPSADLGGAVSPDGSRAAYCGNAPAGVFAIATHGGQPQKVADAGFCGGPFASFSADGNRLLFGNTAQGATLYDLFVWDARTGTTTKVPSASEASPYWISGTGRFVFYISPSTGASPAEILGKLFVFDVDTQSTQSLGGALWVTPSADGASLAFERSDGRLIAWSDAAGAVADVDSIVDANPSLRLAPDGQHVLYSNTQHELRLLALGSTTSTLVAPAVACTDQFGNPTMQGAGSGVFSPDSRAIGFVSPIAGQCSGGQTMFAFHVVDIASGADHSSAALPGSILGYAVASGGGVAYQVQTTKGLETHVWSASAGDVLVRTDTSVLPLYVGITEDTNRLVVVPSGSITQTETMFLWDRSAGTVPLATYPDNSSGYLAAIGPSSGMAVAYDEPSRSFVLARPGSPPAPWVDGGQTFGVSASGYTLAAQGGTTNAPQISVAALASGKAAPPEGVSKIVATTDAHVYFLGADGLCDEPVP